MAEDGEVGNIRCDARPILALIKMIIFCCITVADHDADHDIPAVPVGRVLALSFVNSPMFLLCKICLGFGTCARGVSLCLWGRFPLRPDRLSDGTTEKRISRQELIGDG